MQIPVSFAITLAICSTCQAREKASWKQMRFQQPPQPEIWLVTPRSGNSPFAGLVQTEQRLSSQPSRRTMLRFYKFPSKQQLSQPYDAGNSQHFLTSDRDYETNVT